jgi:hypothetical protein
MPTGRGEVDERSMFAEELIAMRNQRGWTQEETAAKMLRDDLPRRAFTRSLMSKSCTGTWAVPL